MQIWLLTLALSQPNIFSLPNVLRLSAKLSPITLPELGFHVKDRKLIIYCSDRFLQKGNVQIVCKRFEIRLIGSPDEFARQSDKKPRSCAQGRSANEEL